MFGQDTPVNQNAAQDGTSLFDNVSSLPTSDATTTAPLSLPDPVTDTAPSAPIATAPVSLGEPAVDDLLLEIKQQALQQLSPLVGHLEQSPEEKFRTTMMMIQASDDQSLIKAAYEAAQEITDEKTRAQALLDVVNEINYFTQQQN